MDTTSSLVSIVMPVYNGEQYIAKAIRSVCKQTYTNWQLLVVNDGSTDNSERALLKFRDERIHYYKQENKGVSAARNLGIANMKGDFLCFLDVDDTLTPNSLESRLRIFDKNSKIEFVDGVVDVFDHHSNQIQQTFVPDFKGNPFEELIALSGKCFFGPTWMIKISSDKKYQFKEGLAHGEDLLFYLSISTTGNYSFTNDVVYSYRIGNKSAMTNLRGLEKGYLSIYDELQTWDNIEREGQKIFLNKIKTIMWKSYLSKLQIFSALKIFFK